MAHTSAQNAKSIRLGSGIFRKGGLNLGLLEKASLEVTTSVLQIKADNGRLPPRKKVEKVVFSASLYEINLANFDKIDGLGVSTQVAGTATNVTGEVLQATGTVATGTKFVLTNANGSGAVVTAIALKNGATAINATDYTVTTNEAGKTVIIYTAATALTLSGVGLNVGYTYTPAASRVYTVNDVIRAIQLEDVVFENIDENGKKFKITIPQGYNTENMKLDFGSDEKLDEAMKLPIKIEAYPDSQNRMLIIEDEQAV